MENKIYVAEYLKYLNEQVDYCIKYHYIKKESVKKLNCRKLAELCNVTPATISNLNTDSKFSLIERIASEILDSYYSYFDYEGVKAYKEEQDPDVITYIAPRDEYYIILYLTRYYTKEWLFN